MLAISLPAKHYHFNAPWPIATFQPLIDRLPATQAPLFLHNSNASSASGIHAGLLSCYQTQPPWPWSGLFAIFHCYPLSIQPTAHPEPTFTVIPTQPRSSSRARGAPSHQNCTFFPFRPNTSTNAPLDLRVLLFRPPPPNNDSASYLKAPPISNLIGPTNVPEPTPREPSHIHSSPFLAALPYALILHSNDKPYRSPHFLRAPNSLDFTINRGHHIVTTAPRAISASCTPPPPSMHINEISFLVLHEPSSPRGSIRSTYHTSTVNLICLWPNLPRALLKRARHTCALMHPFSARPTTTHKIPLQSLSSPSSYFSRHADSYVL